MVGSLEGGSAGSSSSHGGAGGSTLLERKIALMEGHYLFVGLEREVIERLAATSPFERFQVDEYLFRKGEEGDALIGVASGKIAITTEGPKAKTIVLNIMEAGDFFGEIAFLDGLERTADAQAIEPCEVLRINRRDFLPILGRAPTIAQRLIEMLCERVRWTSESIEDAWFLDPSARLAKCFIRLAMGYGQYRGDDIHIDLALTQTKVAQMTGTSRERVNRELRKWESQGWLARHDNYYIVKKLDALKELVESALSEDSD